MGEVIQAAHRFAGSSRMSKKQAALYLGVTPRYIELRMKDAGLPHWHEGRRVWFSRGDLDLWLEEGA